MHYQRIDVKLDGRLHIPFNEDGSPIYPDYRNTAMELFEEWEHQRFVCISFKKIRQGVFTFCTASHENEDMTPYVELYVQRIGGKIKTLTVSEADQQAFLEATQYSKTMGYLRNPREICTQLGIEIGAVK